MEIGILFNDCECKTVIHGKCVAAIDQNTTATTSQFIAACCSPNNYFPSKLNPFVIHGDNLLIILAQNEICNENLIALQNCSKHCIKFEWNKMRLNKSLEIQIEPSDGYLKAGFTKLFRVTVRSLGYSLHMMTIPLKCSISRYNNEIFREYNLPDGYFEFTDKGYYEKVS